VNRRDRRGEARCALGPRLLDCPNRSTWAGAGASPWGLPARRRAGDARPGHPKVSAPLSPTPVPWLAGRTPATPKRRAQRAQARTQASPAQALLTPCLPLPRGPAGTRHPGTLRAVPLPVLRRFTECFPRVRMSVFSRNVSVSDPKDFRVFRQPLEMTGPKTFEAQTRARRKVTTRLPFRSSRSMRSIERR
jgi:hypothetical protein